MIKFYTNLYLNKKSTLKIQCELKMITPRCIEVGKLYMIDLGELMSSGLFTKTKQMNNVSFINAYKVQIFNHDWQPQSSNIVNNYI